MHDSVPRQQLAPQDEGRWIITTKHGTRHLFDLEACTYTRLPTPRSPRMVHDGRPMRLTVIERWPTIGGTFFIWADDPDQPEAIEHWRQSGTILSIERAP